MNRSRFQPSRATFWITLGTTASRSFLCASLCSFSCCFFFNDTATTEIYTLSLHDALPISPAADPRHAQTQTVTLSPQAALRSEEHTSELQSLTNLVCRLLLEKKKRSS